MTVLEVSCLVKLILVIRFWVLSSLFITHKKIKNVTFMVKFKRNIQFTGGNRRNHNNDHSISFFLKIMLYFRVHVKWVTYFSRHKTEKIKLHYAQLLWKLKLQNHNYTSTVTLFYHKEIVLLGTIQLWLFSTNCSPLRSMNM